MHHYCYYNNINLSISNVAIFDTVPGESDGCQVREHQRQRRRPQQTHKVLLPRKWRAKFAEANRENLPQGGLQTCQRKHVTCGRD